MVTPFGRGVGALWAGLCEGRTALGEPDRFRADCRRGEPVGEVPWTVPGVPPKQAYLGAALAEALSAAGLPGVPPDALFVMVGQAPASGRGDDDLADFLGPPVPPDLDARTVYLTHACASGAFGLAFARRAILAGLVDTAVVAGGTALNRYEYVSMSAVRAVSATKARPLDRSRTGISLGEGGGAVVLEREDHARARGAAADLAVAGASCRVGSGNAAASDAAVIEDCVRAALADAGAERLDYVHAHATGTPQGDREELAALDAVATALGLADLPVDSHKGATGHLLHVSCLVAVAATAVALRTGTASGTPNLTDPEPSARLRLSGVPTPLPADVPTTAAVTSFGFGGNNATLVLTRDP
ncbi:beta-ketoacyl-ACP synthase [Saccharothrix xinjiangensis]